VFRQTLLFIPFPNHLHTQTYFDVLN